MGIELNCDLLFCGPYHYTIEMHLWLLIAHTIANLNYDCGCAIVPPRELLLLLKCNYT